MGEATYYIRAMFPEEIDEELDPYDIIQMR